MLWEFLKRKMLCHLTQIVCEEGAEMTYEEVIVYVETFSKQLTNIKCCAILCESEMAASLALLSCFAAQVTALPISKRYGMQHCSKILDAVSPDALITDEDGAFQITYLTDATYKRPRKKPALIMCTSGTTGAPKAAMLSEENVITNVKDIMAYFAIQPEDTILISRPLYHCAVLTGEFLTALVKGVSIRFYSGVFNPPKVLQLLNLYAITVFCGTPTLLSMMAQLKRDAEGEQLKHISISGECMNAETAKRIRVAFPESHIYHVYGLTEACPRVSYMPPHLFDKYPDYVGGALHSVQIKIVLENGKRAQVNEVGVLWIRGDNVMLGYYNDPKATARVLKNGWLCTGDLALVNEEGFLKIMGRNDDLIIRAGMNIYPCEIENELMKDSRVREVAALSNSHKTHGTELVLHIVGDFINVNEVKQLCRTCLPPYQMPTKIVLTDTLPKNASGKHIRRCS